jgi:hypothetical protein
LRLKYLNRDCTFKVINKLCIHLVQLVTWEKEKEGIAYLIAIHPMIDENGESYIPLMYTFPLGNEMSVDQNSVLVRPFYKVLKEGKPMGTISYIFYQEGEDYFILALFNLSPILKWHQEDATT